MIDPRHVPPTLVDAVNELARSSALGFTFARSDGSERHMPFAEIREEARRRACHFAARGLVKGDRLALVVPDPDEFVLSFLGAIFAGVVPVPMVPQLSFKNVETYHDTVAHIARASGAKLLLTTESTRPYVAPAAERVDTLLGVLTTSELTDPMAGEVDARVGGADVCFLQFTSGSTSKPKGVVVTHNNLAWNSESFMVHGLEKDSSFDKGVSWLPLFHDMGLIGFVIGPLFTNIPVVFLPTASFVRNPRLWLDTIHKHRGTITYAPNFAYQLVAKRLKERDVEGWDLSCMRRTGCGAEPIQSRTLREFAAKLAPAGFDPKSFIPSYGMAEATLAVTFTPLGAGLRADRIDPKAREREQAEPSDADDAHELVNCGRPFPGHELAIVDADGKRLGDRQVGQIVTRGPSVCQGYYQEPELTQAAFQDGWLQTGDLGYLVDGELFVCGRLKDLIIVRGRNFYPNDLEWVVSELPGVRRGNVVAFSVDGESGEELVICAEAFQSEAKGLPEAIAQAVLAHFALNVYKVVIVPQGTLPRTSSGKAQRRKTRQLFLEGALDAAHRVQGPGEPVPAAAP
ncbi:MAG: fatty acyl-AMP ligase [Myxococcales bacterium]|nr:fatty acyl-AMP ligase [Myxococcales bacterium]HQY61398.1 fatty acyl-AMP ligase [Polyangiaceae bacterium]